METKYYMPKFKIGDIVKYRGIIREGCCHLNYECGKILSRPNFIRPYYLIEVMDYDGTPLTTIRYNYKYIVMFLTTAENLTLWELNK